VVVEEETGILLFVQVMVVQVAGEVEDTLVIMVSLLDPELLELVEEVHYLLGNLDLIQTLQQVAMGHNQQVVVGEEMVSQMCMLGLDQVMVAVLVVPELFSLPILHKIAK
jgi:hypothetical protein